MELEKNNLVFPFTILANTAQNKLFYLLKSVAISTLPALCISYLISLFFPDAESPVFPEGIAELFFAVVIFAPIVESLLLWLGIAIIQKFTDSIWIVTFTSAFLWGIIHSLGAFAHGFAIFWSFIVFSYVFIVWKEQSRNMALGMCMSVHMGQNVIAFFLMQIPV